jgi:uncharacterized protein (DUF3084 family)
MNYFEQLENLEEQLRITNELIENLKGQRELVESQKNAIELYLDMYKEDKHE